MDDTPDRIEKLWGHLGNLDADQLREQIRRVRADRKIVKLRNSVKKTTRVRSDAAKTKVVKLATADPDMVRRLLEQMNGKD